MFRYLVCLIAFTVSASAQVAPKADESLQEQIVPESFVVTGTAIAGKINWFWRTNISYSIVNKTGMNLYIGVRQDGGVSLGTCSDLNVIQGGLPPMPSPTARVYSAPAGSGPPSGAFVPASAKISGIIIMNDCAAPNPGSPTAPLSLTLVLGKTNDWRQMITLPLSADIPIRQLPE